MVHTGLTNDNSVQESVKESQALPPHTMVAGCECFCYLADLESESGCISGTFRQHTKHTRFVGTTHVTLQLFKGFTSAQLIP